MKNELTERLASELLETLENRFNKNMHRHPDIPWKKVEEKLKSSPSKMQSLHLMELSGGEPDVVQWDKNSSEILFCDCSKESPKVL